MTRAAFEALYAECLAEAVRTHPDEYQFPPENVPAIAQKMMAAMPNVNIRHSHGFKLLAKRLGIPYTVTAVTAAWRATEGGTS